MTLPSFSYSFVECLMCSRMIIIIWSFEDDIKLNNVSWLRSTMHGVWRRDAVTGASVRQSHAYSPFLMPWTENAQWMPKTIIPGFCCTWSNNSPKPAKGKCLMRGWGVGFWKGTVSLFRVNTASLFLPLFLNKNSLVLSTLLAKGQHGQVCSHFLTWQRNSCRLINDNWGQKLCYSSFVVLVLTRIV